MTMLKFSFYVCILYVAYCGVLFLMQRQMMFPHQMIETPKETKNIPGLEKIFLDTEQGKTEAWFFPPVTKQRKIPCPAIIFAHGNAELIDFWTEEFEPFTHIGIGVLLVEYPGYGRSEGKASQRSVTDVFVAAYNFLVSRKKDIVDSSRMILIGRSIGGGAICQLAAKQPSAALILMSTFTGARTLAAKYLAPGFLVRDTFDNLAVVRDYPGHVLVVHGENDEVIPYSHGVSLYRAAKQGKMIGYAAGHNDCPPDWNLFRKEIRAFLCEAGIIDPLNIP
ncbi:MAG: hypothetical protein BWK80_47300 [Desulfobacteraceae bacterium IS3]|nr:MAG: hypothetical protein BWK80_47300 [Desulfobacteraceae bacterium IS3]